MKPQLIKKNLEFIKVLPSWAQDMSYKYLSKTANLYLLHGNIRDFLPHQVVEGEFIFTRIQEYVAEVLFGNRDIIAYFDRSSGINFNDIQMRHDYIGQMTRTFPDVPEADFLSPDPLVALHHLEKYFLMNVQGKKRIVLIIDYAETVLPAGDMAAMSEEDRTVFVTLNRWSHDPIFTQGDVSILLLTETLTDLNPKMVASPHTVKVEIPLPDEAVRQSFLDFLLRQEKLFLDARLSTQTMARVTSGLNLMNLNQIARESYEEDREITLASLRDAKKLIIENEAGGLLEFIESPFDLSLVSGHEFVKRRFKSAAKAIKQGRLDVLPMGYLIAGAVGTGKSFLVTAFTGELGIPMVKFRNFRTRWQGASDSNLEKILNILKAMAPVAVMIDEADVFLGSQDRARGEAESRNLFANLANFMGNTEYRGRILWFLITCRPDLIPMDLKRQGRAEEHLALFYPETPEDKEHLFDTLIKKLDLKIRDFPLPELIKKIRHDFSGADLEAILIRAKFAAALDNRTFITRDDLEDTIRDFVPPTYPHEIELQNLVAVLECTSREMVPRRFQNLDRQKIISEIKELKTLLGE